jgi:ubiquinone biosynthesis protein Coq4
MDLSEAVMADAGVASLVGDRYAPAPHSTDRLLALPAGSLGETYARFLRVHHFNPHFFHGVEGESDLAYVLNRLRATHDIWHVLLGFDASEAGECGMNAFTFAQACTPTTCLLMAAKMVRSIPDAPAERRRLLQAIADGINLGLRAPCFLGWRWEEHWGEPLADLRQRLGLSALTPAMQE